MVYKTKGTCSVEISFDVIDGKLHNVKFTGGCPGCDQSSGRNYLWFQIHFMSGSACKSPERSAEPVIRKHIMFFAHT